MEAAERGWSRVISRHFSTDATDATDTTDATDAADVTDSTDHEASSSASWPVWSTKILFLQIVLKVF